MATMREPNAFGEVSVEPSDPDAKLEPAIGQTPPSDLMKEAKAIHPRQSPVEEIESFFDLAIDELIALRTRAEAHAIARAADLILESEARGGRVHVTGIGKSEHIARYVAALLSSTGTPAYFLHATECLHGSLGQVCANDITIAISNSGTTPELLHAIEVLRESDIGVVAVTGNGSSPLARLANVILY